MQATWWIAPFILVGCGGKTREDASEARDATADDVAPADAAFDGTGRIPKRHRPAPVACPTDRPPGKPADAGVVDAVGSECFTDSDCTAGSNGRCSFDSFQLVDLCSYDLCFADTDCATGEVCVCRADLGSPSRHERPPGHACERGTCVVDADCGPNGYCSPNVVVGCESVLTGWYCHTKDDRCIDDEDCNMGDGRYLGCKYDPVVGFWACVALGGCSG